MAKVKTKYFCQNCGYQSAQWIGKCPECNEWNTFVEEVVSTKKETHSKGAVYAKQKPQLINNIESNNVSRIILEDKEFNRVLGGGVVLGSVTLVGGEPGIGKSTLLLQIALQMKKHKVLYVSGEESAEQIKMRAERLHNDNDDCYILNETSTEEILRHVKEVKPSFVVIDSIQTIVTEKITSSAGSVSQIRESTSELLQMAKYNNIPVFLIGHITKEGHIAGPKILEHMVDTVLQFEGDRNYGYRILRSIKNRFGSTSELGIYEMRNTGMREVNNPSEILITQRQEDLSGISVAATLEGMRPMLIEVQALVSSAAYGTPQRSTTGFDTRRLNMLLAVLEKRSGFKLGVKDVFLNIAGGLKVDDPAIDLAVVASVLSSSLDIAINQKYCFAAEVGLSGEIRSVNKIEQRISEAEKLGFEKIFISKYNTKGLDVSRFSIDIVVLSKIQDLYYQLF